MCVGNRLWRLRRLAPSNLPQKPVGKISPIELLQSDKRTIRPSTRLVLYLPLLRALPSQGPTRQAQGTQSPKDVSIPIHHDKSKDLDEEVQSNDPHRQVERES